MHGTRSCAQRDSLDPRRVATPCENDPELFFHPEWEEGESLSDHMRRCSDQDLRAKLVCLTECPYVLECLEAGIDEEHGVWGSTSPAERKKMRKGEPIRVRGEYGQRRIRRKDSPTRDFVVDFFQAGASVDQCAEMLGTTRDGARLHLLDEIAILTRDLGSSGTNALADVVQANSNAA